MSYFAPFTANIRVVPYRGVRFETVRSLQKLARYIYGGVDGVSGLIGNPNINLAIPGGGQASQIDSNYNQSDYVPGCAVKPQFGETPAQLMITGFYLVNNVNIQPWSPKQIFFVGQQVTGVGAHGWDSIPDPTVAAEVKALKAIIDGVIAVELPNTGAYLFRIDYKNIIWGDRGFTFPQ